MQTFYLSYKLLQTMFMAVVFLSLIFSLLLLFMNFDHICGNAIEIGTAFYSSFYFCF